MFGLLAGLWKYFFQKEEHQVLIVGLDAAGKTTLLEQLKSIFTKVPPMPFDKIPPTVGLNIGRMEVNGTKLMFWDLGGQSGLRSIWDKYFAEAQALIFVIDSADEPRFDEARQALEYVLGNSDMNGVPLLVFANKQDLSSAKPASYIENSLGLGHDGRRWHIQGVSALTGQDIGEGISWVVGEVKNRENQHII
eukprot:GFYU01028489.1.p1 GENE.GFYU01028489.1~~GFYU01028489.1.p1  ORF type:complete len:193 (-),score=9.13 GFYU01028489.1:315-893(-)